MSKTANIFRPSEVDTFALPLGVFNRLLADPEMKVSTVIVYCYILSKATSPTVRIYIGDALNDTGLSRPVFIEARETLIAANLIRAEETTKQGVWSYEILSERGGKLPTYEDFIVFRDQQDEIIEAYYCDRLGVGRASEVLEDEIRFACPFHTEQDGINMLKVRLNRGNGLHGRFICGKRRCGRRGGMIEFEQAWSKAKHDKSLTKSQASQAVRSFIVGKQMTAEEKHLNATEAAEIPTL